LLVGEKEREKNWRKLLLRAQQSDFEGINYFIQQAYSKDVEAQSKV
jgi:hypothetical protein